MHYLYLALLPTVSYHLNNHDVLCEAFPITTGHPNTASFTTIHHTSSVTALHMHAQDEHGNFFDVEVARRKLEALVTGSGALSENPRNPAFDEAKYPSTFASSERKSSLPETPALDINLPIRAPLTTIERERRLAEIELLSTLDEGDDMLADIWELWFSERGPQAASLLHKADDLMNEGTAGCAKAETILRALIEDHGVFFSEPLNRLATIYYLQGRMEEALTLNKMVLAVKPWHFGALSHIVMVYAALGDSQSARQWAAFRLPTFEPEKSNKRRVRWVERAVTEANILLSAREDTIARALGDADQDWVLMQNSIRDVYENGNNSDSWQ